MKSLRLRNRRKKYQKNKKQTLCKIPEKIRNTTSEDFLMFLITQNACITGDLQGVRDAVKKLKVQ